MYLLCLKSGGGPPMTYFIELDSNLVETARITYNYSEASGFLNDSVFVLTQPGLKITKINTSGDTLWSYFLNEEFALPSDITFHRNNSVVVAGRIDDGQAFGYIMKISDSLITTSSGSLPIFEHPKFYPNPADKSIRLEISESLINKYGSVNVHFFDLTGKSVRNYSDIMTDYEFNIQDIQAGIYQYVIQNKFLSFKGKIVIQ